MKARTSATRAVDPAPAGQEPAGDERTCCAPHALTHLGGPNKGSRTRRREGRPPGLRVGTQAAQWELNPRGMVLSVSSPHWCLCQCACVLLLGTLQTNELKNQRPKLPVSRNIIKRRPGVCPKNGHKFVWSLPGWESVGGGRWVLGSPSRAQVQPAPCAGITTATQLP